MPAKFKLAANEVMFTSDTHFGHAGIIDYCSRPFTGPNHMDESMIRRWNEVVRPEQIVFHVGDFALVRTRDIRTYLDRLNGRVILIRGNHDHTKSLKYFSEVHDLAELTVEGQHIVLCHYRMTVWNRAQHGAWHLHGHSHGSLPEIKTRKVLDIGVDCWDYTPVSFWRLKKEMDTHGNGVIDHHGRKTK